MGLLDKIGFGGGKFLNSLSMSDEFTDIFPFPIKLSDFVLADVITIYSKIMTEVAERTSGLSDEQQNTLWDSCLMDSSNKGLITLIAEAMANKSELFLIYDRTTKLLRTPTSDERSTIEADYKREAKSSLGIYASFKNLRKTDMLKIYSSLEYCTLGGFNKSVNLSNSLIFKMNDLRSSVANGDAESVVMQAQAVAGALQKGRASLADAKDVFETPSPDITPTVKSFEFINQRRSYYLGLTASYVSGLLTESVSGSGEQDKTAVERGLKPYFLSIFKPICEALFDVTLTYKSQDVRQISQALEALKTFELIENDGLITQEEKRTVITSLLNIDVSDS